MNITIEKDSYGRDMAVLVTANGTKRSLTADSVYVRASDGSVCVKGAMGQIYAELADEEMAMACSFPRVLAAQDTTKAQLAKLQKQIDTLNAKASECHDLELKQHELAEREAKVTVREDAADKRDAATTAREAETKAALRSAQVAEERAERELADVHRLAAKIDTAHRVLLDSGQA